MDGSQSNMINILIRTQTYSEERPHEDTSASQGEWLEETNPTNTLILHIQPPEL